MEPDKSPVGLAAPIDLDDADSEKAAAGQLSDLNRATIMMVDDEPITMDVVQAFLEDAGYRDFVLVENSVLAMDQIHRCRPDLLLLDLVMPEVDGFQILAQVRRDPTLTHLPVIMLTSASDAETKLRALDLGATDFLAKPVDPSELALRVRNTLAAKAYVDQLAYYDNLTNLPNRRLFIDRLDWALQHAAREQLELAVLHVGLDDFSRISDTFGPKVGDEVIKQVAQQIDDCVRASDVVARGVGQEGSTPSLFRTAGAGFSVLCPVISSTESAALVAQRVLGNLAMPFDAGGTEVSISASIGIAGYPADGDTSSLLIDRSVGASSQARDKGGSRYEFFSRELNGESLRRLQLEADLRRGIEEDQLVLHYQPKVDVRSGELYGVEALVRWRREPGSLVYPDRFIGVAEESGLIVAIGDRVLRSACDQLQAWHAQGFNVSVAVNLSARQFFDGDLLRSAGECLASRSIDPRYLTLELTESLLMRDAGAAVEMLHQLKATGSRISIDDFGTGYSSLSYLKTFPIDELKIDRSFIGEVMDNPKSRAIVSTVIYMAHQLGLKVVAEGVEEAAQLKFLAEIGCDAYQGYYFSRPVPAEDLTAMLTAAREARLAV